MSDSPMRTAAVAAHELYSELRGAGFGRSEAIELVARFIVSAGQSAQD